MGDEVYEQHQHQSDDIISKNPRNGWILSSLNTLQKRLVDDELHKMYVDLVDAVHQREA